ncbi:MAG: hypothetical protein ABWY52_08605 [Candidatus Limnocylindrales bacterium]
MATAGRPITALAFCLVLGACTSNVATAPASPSEAPTTTVDASRLPTPELTEAPTAPVPSPGSGAPFGLVIRAISCNDVCGPQPGTTVLSDGRVIWRSEGPTGGIMVERQLTPAGLELIRQAIDATGLLEASGSYSPTVRPGKDPPGHGITSHAFKVARDDGLVVVNSDDPGAFEADNQVLGDVWDIPQETYALADLATKLSDVEAWLPADAWADPQRPHQADAYLLIVTAERAGDLPPFADIDVVRWPFPATIDRIGLPYAQQGAVVENSRCLPITRELATIMAAAERVVGYERTIDEPYVDFSYAWARGPGSINVGLRMLLPDQPVTCLEGGAW